MRKAIYAYKPTLKVDATYEAEGLEVKLRRITETNEPLAGDIPIAYTKKTDGVLPAYDIRTDRFEIAREAMSKIQESEVAKEAQRMDVLKPVEKAQELSEIENKVNPDK